MVRPLAQGPAPPQLPAVLGTSDPVPLGDDVEWSATKVTGDFSSQRAERVEVSQCRVESAGLTAVDLPRLRVTDTVFLDCELSGATFHEAVLTRVEFKQCRMLGLSLSGARLHDITLFECRLDGAEFRMTDCARLRFDRCALVSADFYGARLSQVSIFDSDLTDVEFSKAVFKDGRLHGSRLERIRGGGYLKNLTIDSTQILPMALQMFTSFGIDVDDERVPPRQGGGPGESVRPAPRRDPGR
jgi:uncharacterized protein YjbI with pentapeptide repeats